MMTESQSRVLLIGYGNPGRLDDGLGPALAAAIEEMKIPGLTVDSDYQLTVEHAHEVSNHDVVIFADASVSAPDPFTFERLNPKRGMGIGTHSVEPHEVLALAHDLFQSEVEGYILAIRGHEFDEFAEQLSEKARANLQAALDFIVDVIRRRAFADSAHS